MADYDIPGLAAAVRTLQRRLLAAGVDPGPVDGIFGPLALAALRERGPLRLRQRRAERGLAPDLPALTHLTRGWRPLPRWRR
jgi:peptidoglycan hydrolase-like protein with peptidoglycan-binding domain